VKVSSRLRELEEEFACLLEQELQRVSDGHSSRYLERKRQRLFGGRFWRDALTQHLEKLERETSKLRDKLGLPLGESPVAIATIFAELCQAARDELDGGRIRIAREMLKRLSSGRGAG